MGRTRLGVAQIIRSSKAVPFENTTAAANERKKNPIKADKYEVNCSGLWIT